ncbi:MAG: hypothetical protein M3Y87_13295 [Myxococcota bacterium]|nr:hypothetical protein [Myxococcota bacterium]
MLTLPVLLVGSILALAASAGAQSAAALPARIDAEIGLPGACAARFANLTVDLSGTRWAIEGCVASAAAACFATSRFVLSDAPRCELTSIVALVQQRMRCPPPRAQPGDPAFSIRMSSGKWEGAPPAIPRSSVRTSGACADCRG